MTFWWMFVVVLLLTYTASLTNLLRVGPTPLEDEQYVRILSLEDLAKQNEVSFGFIRGGSTESYLKNAQVSLLFRLKRRERERERGRETDRQRQTDRQTDRDRQTDIQRDRQRQGDIERETDRQTETGRHRDRQTDREVHKTL